VTCAGLSPRGNLRHSFESPIPLTGLEFFLVKALCRGTSVLIVLIVTAASARAADDPALVRAARSGDIKAIATLIQQKADVNAVAIDGTTALHWAVRAEDVQTVDALIRAGAQVKTARASRRSTSLLIWAMRR
jgi:hypothetical protein